MIVPTIGTGVGSRCFGAVFTWRCAITLELLVPTPQARLPATMLAETYSRRMNPSV
jgi:hypothetical protein